MNIHKNTLLTCKECGRMIIAKPSDFSRGEVQCSHTGCNHKNVLTVTYHYDPQILRGLPGFGELVSDRQPSLSYPLKAGVNIVGVGETCDVRLERFLHDGKCYISRQHCTIQVTFDSRKGILRYQLSDGCLEDGQVKQSLNGTRLQGIVLKKGELVDVSPEDTITLGSLDSFRLNAYRIPEQMLQTYRMTADFDPDCTQ